jgi:hypothetical protein
MTDVNGISAPAHSVDAVESGSPVANYAAAEASEKMLPQSEVDKIVARAKNAAVENYKRLYTEQPQYAQQKYGDPVPAYANAQSQSVNEDNYRKIAAEEAQRMRDDIFNQAQQKQQEEYAQRIVQNFWQKVSPAKESYEDFDKVTGDLNLQSFPNTVQILAEHVENSGDMLYELGKDRLKLAQIEQLANMSPNDAIVQAQRLSNALKERKESQATQTPKAPLSQLQPNVQGNASNVMSWKDLQRKWTA